MAKQYTKEEVRTILKGLTSGSATPRRMMSDAEFESRYDPQAAYERRIISLLERISAALEEFVHAQSPPPLPQQPAYKPPQPPKGTVEL